MKFIYLIKIFLFLLLANISLQTKTLMAYESCSRVAVINYQEILVDTSSSKRGEGLRFYLEKDPISKKLLNTYQEKNKSSTLQSTLSTIGPLFILTGFLQTNNIEGIANRNSLIYTGAILMGISYLSSKTIQYNNERYLKEAVDHYNKKNSPKIFFSPYSAQNSTGFGLGIIKGF